MKDKSKQIAFKECNAKIKEIFDVYRACCIKLKHPNNNLLVPTEQREDIIKYCNNYVNTINLIFNCLDKEDTDFLKEIFIDRKTVEQIGYSSSTFYVKFKHAANSFLKYLI